MIASLGQLIDAMGVECQIFDMGRRIQEISKTTFQQFEHQDIPYPSPYTQKAWLGISFWPADTPEALTLWFIQLPLDEQGKLLQAERDRFLQQLLVGAGKNLQAAKQGNQFEEVLKGNPYIFTPTPEKQASINAKIRQKLNLGHSQYFDAAIHYLQSDLNNWQELPLQGLADVACHWRELQAQLIQAIPELPAQPLISLCQLLESEPLNSEVSAALYQRLTGLLADTGSVKDDSVKSQIIALVRGLSHATDMELKQEALRQCLNSPIASDTELLSTIASRCHMDLFEPRICQIFLENLAQQPPTVFNALLKDLLFIPALRPYLLDNLNRHPSPAVKSAFDQFTTLIRKNMH
ncbi:MAG: DUF3549 family protein [Candidatus Pelagadaptatus aseana]|uniref:DUF3549 family protein n=1 Tax=Candidatus Pelagadaptatus aseana TaxID=3120508 RepID=UPI0039B226E8